MQVFTGTDAVFPDTLDRAVVTIATSTAATWATRRSSAGPAPCSTHRWVSVVFTFHPHHGLGGQGHHPPAHLHPGGEDRRRGVPGHGLLIIAPFTREFAETQPEVFVKETIVRRIGRPAWSWARLLLRQEGPGRHTLPQAHGSRWGFRGVRGPGERGRPGHIEHLHQEAHPGRRRGTAARVCCTRTASTHGRARHGQGPRPRVPTANVQPDKATCRPTVSTRCSSPRGTGHTGP
jgi:hypothetical protein